MMAKIKVWLGRFFRWLFGGPFRNLPPQYGNTVPPEFKPKGPMIQSKPSSSVFSWLISTNLVVILTCFGSPLIMLSTSCSILSSSDGVLVTSNTPLSLSEADAQAVVAGAALLPAVDATANALRSQSAALGKVGAGPVNRFTLGLVAWCGAVIAAAPWE